MSTIATNKGDWVGTKAQYVALNSIETNKRYYITDLETFVITNSAMASALTTYSSLYNVGDVFLCIDSGTYSQNTFYKFNSSSWVEVGQLVSSSEKTTWNNKSNFSGSYNDLTDKPTIPTVNNSTLTIQKNGTTVDTFTANAASDKTINITVPTSASDVGALSSSTKYGASLVLSINSSTYVVTATLKDQDGNTLGTAQTIDLPLESVVVNGSYDSTNKKVVLTLQSGSTIEFSVADLVSGLQTELSASNKLNADYIADGTTNKAYTATEQSKLSGIESGAEVNDVTDFQVNGTSVVSSKIANIVTNTAYNALSNKIATMNDVPVFSSTDVTITEVD